MLDKTMRKVADCLTAGVISDTHGMLSPEAMKMLIGVDLIIHAGDIDTPAVLDELHRIAPVVAVRGNMDRGRWAVSLNPVEAVEIGECLLYVLHDVNQLDIDPAAAGMSAVIHGHTHRPSDAMQNGVRFLNPGSAAQPRHNAPPSIMKLHVCGKNMHPEFIDLK
jgi:putative phosphoesterase